jgi:hypothetical protein
MAAPHKRRLKTELLGDKSGDMIRSHLQYEQLVAGIGRGLDCGHG